MSRGNKRPVGQRENGSNGGAGTKSTISAVGARVKSGVGGSKEGSEEEVADWQIVIQLLHVLIGLLGFYFSAIYFDRLEIDILKEADLTDWIKYALMYPYYIAAVLLAFLVFLHVRDNEISIKKRCVYGVLSFVVVIVAAWFAISQAEQSAVDIRSGYSDIYKVTIDGGEVIGCASFVAKASAEYIFWDVTSSSPVTVSADKYVSRRMIRAEVGSRFRDDKNLWDQVVTDRREWLKVNCQHKLGATD